MNAPNNTQDAMAAFSPADGSAEWRTISEDRPEIGEVVWLWDGNQMWIGGRDMADSEVWLWGNTHGTIWWNGKRWDGDSMQDDDYKPTHWMPLPLPPNDPSSGADRLKGN